MNKSLIVSKVENNLREEVELVDKIYLLQKEMHDSVLNRDWIETEKKLKALSLLSEEFKELDQNLYNLLKTDSEKNVDFFNWSRQFSESAKTRLDSLYKKLKEKIVYSKIQNDVFSSYIMHAQGLVQGLVDIISEERNGKCYTRQGRRVNVDMTSLVLDESL